MINWILFCFSLLIKNSHFFLHFRTNTRKTNSTMSKIEYHVALRSFITTFLEGETNDSAIKWEFRNKSAFYYPDFFIILDEVKKSEILFQVEIVETEPDKVSGDEYDKNSEDDDAATSSENSNVSVSASENVYSRKRKRYCRSWYICRCFNQINLTIYVGIANFTEIFSDLKMDYGCITINFVRYDL